MAAAACCGDDSGEYRKLETGGSDAPAGYGDLTDTCCNVITDCPYTYGAFIDVCVPTGTTSAPARPSKAYCNAGTWQGGDAGSIQCNNIMGSIGYWGLGGITNACCGDDSNEYKRTETGTADAPPQYKDGNPDPDVCCSSNTACNYDNVCVASGSTSAPGIPNKAYCNAGTWQGGDDSATACQQITGAANLWGLGGLTNFCCGDDNNENRRICLDGGAGACLASGDDEACCADSSACVYDDTCYSDGETTPDGAWVCQSGTWIPAGVDVEVVPTPLTVTTVWQNIDATAEVNCTSPSPLTPCDPTSYRLQTFASDPGTCPTDYATYTLPDPQTISDHVWVCGAARNTAATEGFSDPPTEFMIDKDSPTAFLRPLPAWTNQTSVIITWNGNDPAGGSGIDYFVLFHRITWVNGTLLQDWTEWGGNPSSNPGSLPSPVPFQNNKTYSFRVQAVDNAGNIGPLSPVRSVSADLQPPMCMIEDLPLFTNQPAFYVNWSGTDGETGVMHYDVQGRANVAGCGMPTAWGWLNDPDGYQTTDTSDTVIGIDGCTYFFRCRATDDLWNLGAYSAEKNTTVDASAPTSSVDPLPQWWNRTLFNVTWSGSDSGVGIECFDIQYRENETGAWTDWLTCTTLTEATFGPGSPVTLISNATYYFRSRARDLSGGQEAYPATPDAETTIDFYPPEYGLKAYDQNGRSLIGGVLGLGVENITFQLSAVDYVSGVAENIIEWIITLEGGESYGSYDCGPASPYGGISQCNHTLDQTDLSGMIMIEFWVRTIDRAGNMNISGSLNLGTHPLANFGRHSIYIAMGESAIVGVFVRNIKDQPDNVTVTLTSTLPVDPYFVILEDMYWNLDRWVGDDIELMNDNKTLIIYNLNPGAAPPPFPVRIWSSDTPSTYQMNLDAQSALAINDTDQAAVQVNYPASFPGLNEWAIVILIALAVLVYARFEKVI